MPVPCQSHINCKKLEGQLIAILIIAKYSVLLLALILLDLSDVNISSYHIFLFEMSLVSVILYSASSSISSCTWSYSFMGSFFLTTFLKLMFFRDQLASHFILQMHPILLHLLHWLQLTFIYTNNSHVWSSSTFSLQTSRYMHISATRHLHLHVPQALQLSTSKMKPNIFVFPSQDLVFLPVVSSPRRLLHLHHCPRQGVILNPISLIPKSN